MNNAEFNRLKRLAKIVIPTIEKNKKQRIEKERRGDFFNIFSILKVERNEVYTHSAMLCELLNPKGSHGMSDKFLSLFLEEIPLRRIYDINQLNTKNASINKEFSIGPINRKKEKGGQIDILIEFKASDYSPEYAIVIENKIDARDQEAQLARYYHYLIDNYPKKNFTILYLTKFGNPPSAISIGKHHQKNKPYWNCISYSYDIQKWQKKCLDVSGEILPVKETLKQYSNLINKITDKELNMADNKKLIRQIYAENLFETAVEFVDIWQQKDTLIAEIIADMILESDEKWVKLENFPDTKTIFKLIDVDELYLFFEPSTLTLGFYREKGLIGKKRKLTQIIQEVSLHTLRTNVEQTLDDWCYISFAYAKEEKSPSKTAIEDYYNEIYKALKTFERKYKRL